MTLREAALRAIQIGDLFNVAGSHDAPITCLTTAIDEETIYARSITHQLDIEFDRRTGTGHEKKYSLGGTINSVAPLPPDIHATLLQLERRYRSGNEDKLSVEERRALLFIYDFYEEKENQI